MSSQDDDQPQEKPPKDDQAAVDPAKDNSQQLDELTADLKRIQADFVNFRRRAEAEKSELLDFAKTRVVREFLAVRDSFDHELSHRPESINPEWAKSIDQIRIQFDQVLKSLSVERFDSKGQPFDPHLHDAVAMEDGGGDAEIITDVMQPGYKMNGQILRHAVVKVGKVLQDKKTQQDRTNN